MSGILGWYRCRNMYGQMALFHYGLFILCRIWSYLPLRTHKEIKVLHCVLYMTSLVGQTINQVTGSATPTNQLQYEIIVGVAQCATRFMACHPKRSEGP